MRSMISTVIPQKGLMFLSVTVGLRRPFQYFFLVFRKKILCDAKSLYEWEKNLCQTCLVYSGVRVEDGNIDSILP